jgi:hypothetical protein
MSLRPRAASAPRSVASNRLRAVLAAVPVNNNYERQDQDQPGLSDLPDEVVAMIIINSVNETLQAAEQSLQSLFFAEDGPAALRALCAALFDLASLKLTNKAAYNVAASLFGRVVDRLRAFLGRVAGWNKRSPNEHVALMCRDIEELLDVERIVPPPLSLYKANYKRLA